jgi:hypothetical protein
VKFQRGLKISQKMKMVVEGGGTKDYFYSDQPFFACEIIIHATAIGCLVAEATSTSAPETMMSLFKILFFA